MLVLHSRYTIFSVHFKSSVWCPLTGHLKQDTANLFPVEVDVKLPGPHGLVAVVIHGAGVVVSTSPEDIEIPIKLKQVIFPPPTPLLINGQHSASLGIIRKPSRFSAYVFWIVLIYAVLAVILFFECNPSRITSMSFNRFFPSHPQTRF